MANTYYGRINEAARRAGDRYEQPLYGRYLQEKIRNLDWDRLADRTAPLPADIPLPILMREFENLYAFSYDEWAERIYHITPTYKQRQR